MKTLAQLREQITALDQDILESLVNRLEISGQIRQAKQTQNLPIYDPIREKELLESYGIYFEKQDLSPEFIKNLYKEIMSYSKILQAKPKNILGIQGIEGSYNDIVAQKYILENNLPWQIKYLENVKNVFKGLDNGEIEFGQFAICNSIGGVVQEALETIGKYSYRVKTSYTMPIVHCLLGLKNEPNYDKVMGHIQALKQCEKTLKHLKPSFMDGLLDNGSIAKALSEHKLPKGTVVVGSEALARIYGLEILQKGVQDRDDNTTTFVLICK